MAIVKVNRRTVKQLSKFSEAKKKYEPKNGRKHEHRDDLRWLAQTTYEVFYDEEVILSDTT